MAIYITVNINDYELTHNVVVSWSTSDTKPAQWYAWRVYATDESSVYKRKIYDSTTYGSGTRTTSDTLAVNADTLYEIVSVTQDTGGAQTETTVTSILVTPFSTDYWLVHPTDNSLSARLFICTADTNTDEYEELVFNLIGKGRKADNGEKWGETGTLTIQMRDNTFYTASRQKKILNNLKATQSYLYLFDPFGERTKVFIKAPAYTRMAGMGTHEANDVSLAYEELA